MLYLVLHTQSKFGTVANPINPYEVSKNEIKKMMKSYNCIRVSIEFIFNNRSIFKYNLKNISDLDNIEFFRSFGASTSDKTLSPMSLGFIDKKNKIRCEYFGDSIRVYPLG